jgi:hypothetical protein
MNLWGFQPDVWAPVTEAVTNDHPEVDVHGNIQGTVASEDETLLPEVVGDAVTRGRVEFAVRAASGRCIGVTHAEDLPVAQAELAKAVGRGERSERLWEVRR